MHREDREKLNVQSVAEIRAARAVITGVRGRAAGIAAPEQIELREVEFREPVAGEVRVRIEGCGVCASNVPVWEGKPWFEYPLEAGAPGHEAWGYVDALGDGVTDLAKGDRVALLSSHAFAAYDFAIASQVVQLPPDLNDQPAPAEALGCAVNIFRRSVIAAGQTVAIIGIGFLGTLLTQLAANVGARVFAISRRQSSLKLAERFGAAVTVETARARETIKQLTQHRGCDCVIEAAGTQASLDLATELTSERGRLVIAGYHQDAPRTVDMQTWNWRGLDVINAHEREPQIYVAGMRGAIEAMQSGVLNPLPLYTHTFALDELPRAFETVAESPEGFVKALIII